MDGVVSNRTRYSAMSTLINSLPAICSAVVFLTGALPAGAQNNGYHSSFGNTRVVKQSQNGLSNPSPTYVDSSMSGSAKGGAAGIGTSLPKVNAGSHIRTPGDNLYNNTVRSGNGAVMYQDQYAQAVAKKKADAAKRAAAQRTRNAAAANAAAVKPQRFYVPGQNGAAAQTGAPYTSAPAACGAPASGKRQF